MTEQAAESECQDDEVLQTLYTYNAMEATNLKLVYKLDEFTTNSPLRTFKPELVHQVFGPSEVIFGYHNPEVNLYVTGSSIQYFVDVKYKSVIDSSKKLPPDNIMGNLSTWLPAKYYTDRNQFIRAIERENPSKNFGEIIGGFAVYNKSEKKTFNYVITHCSVSEPGFADFHSRFECMIVWFIDAASQIDLDDPNWIFLYVYEERKLPNKKIGYYPVGYCTIYQFFHFPEKVRARISQLFVIPPCQRTGIGTQLLNAAYKVIAQIPDVIDITVEDPCEGFTKMRDALDCRILSQLSSFKYPAISKGYTPDLYNEANSHFKINKKQCRRIYEILRMIYLLRHPNPTELKIFFDEIKQRIEAPIQREQRNLRKKGVLSPSKQDTYVYQTSISKKEECSRDVASYINNLKSFAFDVYQKLP